MFDRLDRALSHAQREIRMLGAVTPDNVCAERQRLLASFQRGDAVMPRWSYSTTRQTELRRELVRLARGLERDAQRPLALLYAGRARELALEASIADSVGTTLLAPRATQRFGPRSARYATHAHALATRWFKAPVRPTPGDTLVTDALDPRSLVARLREEVSRHRLGINVEIHRSLGALAATGDGVIFVAADRLVSSNDVERTVLHEIMGHAIPRMRARSTSPGIFAIGTAGGNDEQEGFALLLEERHGFFTASRRRQLSARHLSVHWMLSGASFVDVVRRLTDQNFELPQALLVAERAFRGGDGRTPGLGRERVYLESYERVRAHLEANPADEGVLTCGQVSVDAIRSLSPFAQPGNVSTISNRKLHHGR